MQWSHLGPIKTGSVAYLLKSFIGKWFCIKRHLQRKTERLYHFFVEKQSLSWLSCPFYWMLWLMSISLVGVGATCQLLGHLIAPVIVQCAPTPTIINWGRDLEVCFSPVLLLHLYSAHDGKSIRLLDAVHCSQSKQLFRFNEVSCSNIRNPSFRNNFNVAAFCLSAGLRDKTRNLGSKSRFFPWKGRHLRRRRRKRRQKSVKTERGSWKLKIV